VDRERSQEKLTAEVKPFPAGYEGQLIVVCGTFRLDQWSKHAASSAQFAVATQADMA